MKLKAFLELASIAVVLSACNSESTSADYYAFKSSENGKWGMISPQGDVLFEEEFKMQPTDVVGGVFFVQTGKDNLWEIYDAQNKTVSTSDDAYHTILPFYEDVTLAVKNNDFIKVIDKRGNVSATLDKCGGENIIAAKTFHDGLAIVSTGKGVGAVNTKGEVVVRTEYLVLNDFNEGVALGIENKYKDVEINDAVLSIINTKGETILKLKMSKYSNLRNATAFQDGLLPVCRKDGTEERWGFIDTKGEEVVKPSGKNAHIGEWNKDVYVYSDGEQWGLKKIEEDEILIRCKYDKLTFADAKGTLLWACDNTRSGESWSLINRDGEVISKDTYKDRMTFNGDYCPVKISDSEWGFVNRRGEEQKIKTDIYVIGGCKTEEIIYSKNVRKKVQQEIEGDGLAMMDESEDVEQYKSEYSSTSDFSSADSSDLDGEILDLFGEYLGTSYFSDDIESIDQVLFSMTSHELTAEEVLAMPKGLRRIVRNSIFARHGYIFKSEDLKAFFSVFPWYNPVSSNVQSKLSAVEKKNIELIKSYE